MIHDVDETLRKITERQVMNGTNVEMAFDAPTSEWSARQNTPTLNYYLYDIREDLSRRSTEHYDIRDDQGIVVDRRPPARRFKLAYMITAWTQRPEDEHRLLSAVLTCFLGHEYLPPEVLQGALVDLKERIFLTIGLPLANDRSIADTWSALGGELKPSLDLIVNVPFSTGVHTFVGEPLAEQPRFRIGGSWVPTETVGGAPEPAKAKKGKAHAKEEEPAPLEVVAGSGLAEEVGLSEIDLEEVEARIARLEKLRSYASPSRRRRIDPVLKQLFERRDQLSGEGDVLHPGATISGREFTFKPMTPRR